MSVERSNDVLWPDRCSSRLHCCPAGSCSYADNLQSTWTPNKEYDTLGEIVSKKCFQEIQISNNPCGPYRFRYALTTPYVSTRPVELAMISREV